LSNLGLIRTKRSTIVKAEASLISQVQGITIDLCIHTP
jgi:hypothetical protein